MPALLVEAGDSLCALDLAGVSEVMRPLPVEPLSGVPPFVLGLGRVRGAPVPVVDLARLLSGTPSGQPAGRWVSLHASGKGLALAVAGVRGVRFLARERLDPLPPLLARASEGTREAVGQLDGRLLWLLDAARVIPEETWRALEGGAR